MLLACPNAELRARGALELLRAYTGAEAGFIYLRKDDGLCLVAHTAECEPPQGLDEEANRLWQRELETHDDVDATLDLDQIEALQRDHHSPFWLAPTGESFYRFLLHTHLHNEWIPLGVVALFASDDSTPVVGRRHLDAVCAALVECGDVTREEEVAP